MNSAKAVASNPTSMPRPMPRHVAIIMDGNKRWAQQHHLPLIEGHRRGGEALERVINEAVTLAIPYLTVFGFSSENWNRPQQEVSALMNLLDGYLRDKVDELCEKSIALKVIGERALLPEHIRHNIVGCEKKSAGGTNLTLTIALSYGARQDITAAVQKIARELKDNQCTVEDITPEHIGKNLQTHFLPPLDLLIRTSGELRLSNFLLWESAYSEFYFCERLWPDFTGEDLRAAVNHFAHRERRYGS